MKGIAKLAAVEAAIKGRQTARKVPRSKGRGVSSMQTEGEAMMVMRKFLVRKHERAMMFNKGDFVRFLAPGTYWEFDPLHRITVERFDITVPAFEHRLTDFLMKAYADDVEALFEVVETGASEVAVIFENRRPADVIGPDQRARYWEGEKLLLNVRNFAYFLYRIPPYRGDVK